MPEGVCSMHEKQKSSPSPLSPAVPDVTPARRPAPPPSRLKAERVQLRIEPAPGRLKAERVQERLAAMPGWFVVGNGLGRVRELPSPQAAAAHAGFVAQAASTAGQRVVIQLAGSRVTLFLRGRLRDGLTETAMDFAQALG